VGTTYHAITCDGTLDLITTAGAIAEGSTNAVSIKVTNKSTKGGVATDALISSVLKVVTSSGVTLYQESMFVSAPTLLAGQSITLPVHNYSIPFGNIGPAVLIVGVAFGDPHSNGTSKQIFQNIPITITEVPIDPGVTLGW
jgi:hypothetical protein